MSLLHFHVTFRHEKFDIFLDELSVPVHVQNSLNMMHMCEAASPTSCVARERVHLSLIASRRRCHIVCRHTFCQHVLRYPQGDLCTISWSKTQFYILHRRMLAEIISKIFIVRCITNAHSIFIAHALTTKCGTLLTRKNPEHLSADFS